jgi:hypothetical protein
MAGQAFLHPNSHFYGSPTQSSIVHAKNVLEDSYSWHACSGSSLFWFSTWSTFGPLGTLVPYVDIHDLHLNSERCFIID